MYLTCHFYPILLSFFPSSKGLILLYTLVRSDSHCQASGAVSNIRWIICSIIDGVVFDLGMFSDLVLFLNVNWEERKEDAN